MSIFHKRISFTKHDPLGNGLSDEIAAEQNEADSFLNDVSGDELTDHWNAIVKDIEKDPNWFSFSDD